MHSQNTLTKEKEPRVTTTINDNGEYLIQLKLADAKIILNDVLQKQICDSLVVQYEKLDKSRVQSYFLLENKLKLTEDKLKNSQLIVTDITKVVSNKNEELVKLNNIIKEQSKEIFKQKTLKIFGLSAAVVLPITTILIMAN